MNRNFLQKLRVAGFVEGISTLILFGIAMPLKYWAFMPMAVTVVGRIHGGLFVLLVAMVLIAIKRVPLSGRLAMAVIVGAVVPFGPFVVDHRWLKNL